MKILVFLAACAAFVLPVAAQKMQTPTGEAPGPWILGTIGVGKGAEAKTTKETAEGAEGNSGGREGGRVALKGLAIKVGEKGEAAVAYDLDLCRMVGAWTGKFTTPMNLMSRGEYPTAMGEVAFTTGEVPGFLVEGTTKDARSAKADEKEAGSADQNLRALPGPLDPRPEPFGPLPSGHARFKGFYVNGDKTILKWDIAGTEVLEMPGYEVVEGSGLFTRTLRVGSSDRVILIAVCPVHREDAAVANLDELFLSKTWWKEAIAEGKIADSDVFVADFPREMILARCDVEGPKLPWSIRGDQVWVEVSPRKTPAELQLIYSAGLEKDVYPAGANALAVLPKSVIQFPEISKGGPARWPEPVVTQGEVHQSPITDRQSPSTTAAYVVDTIKLPDPNPWSAPMFTSGFDFFDDGRAGSPTDRPPLVPGTATSAVCTFHGDVFVVSGIDEKLEQVTWRRFASGLYHPLGLKVVKGEIFVACRDGLWRLNDLNKDGEADFYELFNGDLKVTKNFHEFVFDLHTDAAGNFYFAKAGPVKNGGRGFDEIMSQHGTLLRVSPDGAKLDVVATGFRAPNGIGVGPRGELTSGDNEGTWTPACKINWIKPGGFYGVVDLAHRNPAPTDYDRPLCWLPKRIDNSGGSQVWAPPGARWGPWGGKMLHLSYGQSSLYGVLMEECGMRNAERGVQEPAPAANSAIRNPQSALVQGGVVKFPLQFQSGIMRARFNPRDGQLYVMGLRGWQTNGLKNGCFQRVRFTGAVPRMPVEMQVKKDGIQLRFACSLDTQSAADPQNWNLEQWRYLWSEAYGSAEYSTEGDIATAAKKHDPVTVKSVAIGTDDRTVFLEIPGLKPVMQMAIKYDLKTADGQELRGEVVNTIHALGAE